MTIEPLRPPPHAALARPHRPLAQRRPHGQRWGEGLDSVLDHLQYDGRHLPHPAGIDRRASRRERKE